MSDKLVCEVCFRATGNIGKRVGDVVIIQDSDEGLRTLSPISKVLDEDFNTDIRLGVVCQSCARSLREFAYYNC
jgi:hypothetical protein